MKHLQRFHNVQCTNCGGKTNRSYANRHCGWCKSCWTGKDQRRTDRDTEQGRLIDLGYEAYSRERGDYDLPDSY